MARLTVHAGPEALGEAVARELARAAEEAIARRGSFRLGLPGGRSPEPLYAALVRGAGGGLPWSAVEVFFADERAVPRSDAMSNARFVGEALLARVGAPAGNVHRMAGDAPDLEAAARDYDALLARRLDALVLGLGEDGHVASLFPGSPLLAEETRRVGVVTDSPKPPPRRLTLLPRAVNEARRVFVLATGAAKAAAVAAALEPRWTAPLAFLGSREWHVDEPAAALLRGRR